MTKGRSPNLPIKPKIKKIWRGINTLPKNLIRETEAIGFPCATRASRHGEMGALPKSERYEALREGGIRCAYMSETGAHLVV